MGNNEDLVGAIGRLIERIDLYEGEGEAMECRIPLDDHPFLDEDVDIKVFVEELRFAMEQLGVTVGEVALVDEAGNEHPLPLPPPRQSWHMRYILDAQGQPVPTNDIRAVAQLLHDGKARTVAKTSFAAHGKRVEISTVFLVLNHAFLPGSAPVLWESMVFTNFQRLNEIQMRYTSKAEALQGHRWLVEYTRKFLGVNCWPRRRRRPTIHQTAAMLRRKRRAELRKRGTC